MKVRFGRLLYLHQQKLSNLCAFVDEKKWQATGRSDILKLGSLKKFYEFGWRVLEIDGHNHFSISACKKANRESSKPTRVIATQLKVRFHLWKMITGITEYHPMQK